MKKIIGLLMIAALALQSNAEEKEKKITVEVHGFVGVNAFFDSRQSVLARNGNIYLWPKAPSYDNAGNDINKHSSYDIDAAFSRFNIGVRGPDMFGAKTFGFMEGDFLGDKAQGNDLYFRLRHAFVRFNWEKSSLLFGQYWHPLFLTENYPSTVTLSAGVPYHPLNRQPMLRFGHQLSDNVEMIVFLMSQDDFSDRGMYMGAEKSLRPEVDLQFKYKKNDFFAAITAGYKTLKPALVDPNDGLITDELAQAGYVAGSIRKKFSGITVKAEALYGGGMSNLVMLGGFAEKDNGSTQRQYTPIQTLSLWTDLHTNHKVVQPGLFVGYTENMGTNEKATAASDIALGGNIGNMYTVAPRVIIYATPKVWLGIEWMYVVAGYAGKNDDGDDMYDEKARPINLENYSNHRITTSLRYTF